MHTLAINTHKRQAAVYNGVTYTIPQNTHEVSLVCRFKLATLYHILDILFGFHKT